MRVPKDPSILIGKKVYFKCPKKDITIWGKNKRLKPNVAYTIVEILSATSPKLAMVKIAIPGKDTACILIGPDAMCSYIGATYFTKQRIWQLSQAKSRGSALLTRSKENR